MIFAACLSIVVAVNAPQRVARPIEDWVFRTSDSRGSGRLVAALHRDFWAEYDPNECALRLATCGSRASAQGDSHDPPYLEGLHSARGFQSWSYIRAGSNIACSVQFKGYTLKNGGLTIHYQLNPRFGKPILINESPEVVNGQMGGQIQFVRVFETKGLAKGDFIQLRVLIPRGANWGFTAPSVRQGEAVGAQKSFDLYQLSIGSKRESLSVLFDRHSDENFLASEEPAPRLDSAVALPVVQMDQNRARPGDGKPLDKFHPSFDAVVLDLSINGTITAMDVSPDRTLYACTDLGSIYSGKLADSGVGPQLNRVAGGLDSPRGIKVVDGKVYVLQRTELTKLEDLDRDGKMDRFTSVARLPKDLPQKCEFGSGLTVWNGDFAAVYQSTERGTTNGMVLVRNVKVNTYAFSSFSTMVGVGEGIPNEPAFVFSGGRNFDIFFADSGFDKEKSNDSKQVLTVGIGQIHFLSMLSGEVLGLPKLISAGPFNNQLMIGNASARNVHRIFVDRVNGQSQGAIFRFSGGFPLGSGILAWDPSGTLVIASQQSPLPVPGRSHRITLLKFNKKPTFEMRAIRAKTNGVEIEFTQPLRPGVGLHPGDYQIRSYDLHLSKGGGREVPVRSVALSSRRDKAFLEIPGMAEGTVLEFRLGRAIQNEKGEGLWSTDAWYTLHRIPKKMMVEPGIPPATAITEAEKKDGFVQLTDKDFRGFKRDFLPDSWSMADGVLGFAPKTQRGDIITKEQYASFELRLDWKISKGGNSGIFFRGTEDKGSIVETAPEMQVLDDDVHSDGANPLSSAGSNYALFARTAPVVRPVGEWNSARIRIVGNHVIFHLNELKIVEFDLLSPEWEKALAASRLVSLPDYGRRAKGHIALQDHGDPVWYRNIRIKRLDPKP